MHAGATDRSAEALWLEARLAAKIVHPGIVPIHEAGVTASGEPYYTMDLVDGTSLRALLREGPVSKLRALLIVRDVAEAIGFAHSRGVVHCDLKPGNVVIDSDGRARVLDFGLAFALSGGALDAKGPVRGSPPYMSPEQIAGEPLTPATDVYSLGVVLHEMLTGELPFSARSLEELLVAVALEEPAAPSKKNPQLGPEIDRLCLACLKKLPGERPADGRALGRAIRGLFGAAEEGAEDEAPYELRRLTPRPAPPRPEAPRGSRTFRVELALASPPERLWPLVSNTERLNRAVGLPHVAFSDAPSAGGAARKTGAFRVLGMDVAWEEHPFEWVHERGHSVFRAYTKGPLAWLTNRVRLEPREGGGSRLVHEVEAAPRGAIGRVASAWEIGWKLTRRLREVYSRLDDAARAERPEEDPFEPPHRPSSSQVEQVEAGLARLASREGRKFPEVLLQRLRETLLFAPDKSVERLRPFALADAWGGRRPEVLDLLLHASNAGLVDVAWDLMCPRCGVAHEVAASLREVVEQAACSACGESYTRDLARTVEVIFRPHKEVRALPVRVYCIGSPAMRPHVLVQQALAPGERRDLVATLPRGDLAARVERRASVAEISSSPAGVSSACELRLGDATFETSHAFVRAGEVQISLVNDTGSHQVFRVERPPRRSDSVTAAAAMTHPTFQAFFSDELLSEGEHLRVGMLAFVAVAVMQRARALEELGDAAAFARFSRLVTRLSTIARREQGVLSRATYDGLLCVFSSPASAVRAAIAIASAPVEAGELGVRVAAHAGRCIAVSRGSRIEYFGETIERAAALLGEASRGVVALSGSFDEDPASVSAMLAPGLERSVGTTSGGDYSGRRFTRLTIS